MALVNRDKDVSEQKDVLHWSSARIAGATTFNTGSTIMMFSIPYPCSLVAVQGYAQGVSSAMQVGFLKQYFTAGGATTAAVSLSNMVLVNYGTSGAIGYSGLPAPGSTLSIFGTGDVLGLVTSVANGAVEQICLNFVLKKLQDIVSIDGVST